MPTTDGWGAANTWYCIRRDGRAVLGDWMTDVSLTDLPRRAGARAGDVVEVCVAGNFRPVPRERFRRVFREDARGLIGMEASMGNTAVRFAPTHLLAANRRFERALQTYFERHRISAADFAANGRLRAFDARQVLLREVDGNIHATELFRGATLVPETPAPGENRAADLADGIGQWMIRNLSAGGGLPYRYWPSRGTEAPADNAIRRFLASLALTRLSRLRGSAEMAAAARRNLRFNLDRYFRDIGGGRGAVVEGKEAKLGAAALAALAIVESPARSEFLPELNLLAAGVASLADDERGFRTFFFPPERDGDNWNFYSGEALLFWAEARRRGLDGAPSLERCAAAFESCRARHLRARNPAFVPWHAQAGSSLFAQTGNRAFADFVLDISDWLLAMQQWDGVAPDLQGRFYDPKRPEFGPPHASSTGVYLEGLADALGLARATGQGQRAAAYERAIQRGLRSLRQLQFRGPCDVYYVSRRERVMGALRTEVYDNTVRVDSAAHALAAAVKILRPTRFGAAPAPVE